MSDQTGDGVLTERAPGTMMQCAAILLAADICLTLGATPAMSKVNDVRQKLICCTDLISRRAHAVYALFHARRGRQSAATERDQDGEC